MKTITGISVFDLKINIPNAKYAKKSPPTTFCLIQNKEYTYHFELHSY